MSSNSNNYLQSLIAHYLATNYPSALPPFLQATNLPQPDPTNPPRPDLRTLVEDYISSTLTSQLGDVDLDDRGQQEKDEHVVGWRGWTGKDVAGLQLKEGVGLGEVQNSLDGISAANLLTVKVARVPYREFDTATAEYKSRYELNIITTSVDKTIKFIDYNTGEVERILEPHRAPILSFDIHPINPRYLITGSMDGSTILTDLITLQPLQTFRSLKFVVRVAFSPDGIFFATASYDKHIVVYQATAAATASSRSTSSGMDMDGNNAEDDGMVLDEHDSRDLACDPSLRYQEVHRIKVDSNPEAVLFHPRSTWLMYTLRNSHLLHYVKLPSSDTASTIPPTTIPGAASISAAGGPSTTWETRSKSFNPHPMDTHVSFSVLNLALHPSEKVIACQTGDHRGGSGERILLYGIEPDETERLGCIWTGNESDDFVLPRMTWLPDGTGLIPLSLSTTSPNGYLNLLSMSGETRSSIKVHGGLTELGQASSEVVRDVAVVPHEDVDEQNQDRQWTAVSVGYDRQIRFTR